MLHTGIHTGFYHNNPLLCDFFGQKDVFLGILFFKKCLRHEITSVMIDDRRQFWYLRRIKQCHDDRFEMIGRVQKAQSRFEAKVELQNLCAADHFFVSVTYQEGPNEDEWAYDCAPNLHGQLEAKLFQQC